VPLSSSSSNDAAVTKTQTLFIFGVVHS
jgi:hypothetical protein